MIGYQRGWNDLLLSSQWTLPWKVFWALSANPSRNVHYLRLVTRITGAARVDVEFCAHDHFFVGPAQEILDIHAIIPLTRGTGPFMETGIAEQHVRVSLQKWVE